MSYRKKSFYKRKYYDNKEKPNYKKKFLKRHYYRSRSGSRDKDYHSKRNNNMFNMYNRNEHLSSSSSYDSFSHEYDDEFFVDREKTCPFLLRIFYKINSFNSLNLFRDGSFPSELNIYTWEDADLDELAKFIHLALKDTVLGNYPLAAFP